MSKYSLDLYAIEDRDWVYAIDEVNRTFLSVMTVNLQNRQSLSQNITGTAMVVYHRRIWRKPKKRLTNYLICTSRYLNTKNLIKSPQYEDQNSNLPHHNEDQELSILSVIKSIWDKHLVSEPTSMSLQIRGFPGRYGWIINTDDSGLLIVIISLPHLLRDSWCQSTCIVRNSYYAIKTRSFSL